MDHIDIVFGSDPINPSAILYFVEGSVAKPILTKEAVCFRDYGDYTTEQEQREVVAKALESFAARDNFLCWARECTGVPPSDEYMSQIAHTKEIGLAWLNGCSLQLPARLTK